MSTLDIAAKVAQRLILRAAIGKIQELINTANHVKGQLNTINAQMLNSSNKWTRTLSAFQSSEMAAVVVADKFEGECAEKISGKLPEPIAEMEATNASAAGVRGEIAEQINKLNIYIEQKETEKAELQAQLAAL